MTVDLRAAAAFLATTARVLDRRRFALLTGTGGTGASDAVLAALDAYRNADGGYGWGLEPDLRAPESQPAGALHAFDVLAEVAPATSPHAMALCDWLDAVALPGGALPFALGVADPAGCAPFWAQADPTAPSLHLTSAVVASARRVAVHDAAVAAHPWPSRAAAWCLDQVEARAPESAHELMYVLGLLDLLAGGEPRAAAALDRLAEAVPDSGVLAVEGGAPDEALRPLDLAPLPDRPVRALLRPEAIDADLDRLAGGQAADGGWTVDFTAWSPAAALEWRGHTTVEAIRVLRANGRLDA